MIRPSRISMVFTGCLATACVAPISRAPEPTTRPDRAALVVVATASADCAAELRVIDRLVVDLVRTTREVFVLPVVGTAAGATLMNFPVDQGIVGENSGATRRHQIEVQRLLTSQVDSELCSRAGGSTTGLDVVELMETSVRRAIAVADGRPMLLYVVTTGLHVTTTDDITRGPPSVPDLSLLVPTGSLLDTVIVGPGDFGRLAPPNLDGRFVQRVTDFAHGLCTSIGRCSVLPTLAPGPEVPQ